MRLLIRFSLAILAAALLVTLASFGPSSSASGAAEEATGLGPFAPVVADDEDEEDGGDKDFGDSDFGGGDKNGSGDDENDFGDEDDEGDGEDEDEFEDDEEQEDRSPSEPFGR